MEIIWNVVDKNGNKIKPLEFDGRTQKDVVREICEAFESYDKVFFISPPGTGKSLIALVTIFNKFLKGIIVVPTKHLQRQYYNDYNPETGRLRIPNFKIEFIMGRSNFICPQFRKLCSNSTLPCTRRLKSGEKRYEICMEECPYWVPQRYNEKLARYIANKINKFPLLYTTASGKRAIFETECPFFRQFLAYIEADAIIMNDKIWYLETISKRKPVGKHVVEIIDECLVEGTKILTPNGIKRIEEIKVGDRVYTLNEKTGKIEIKRVIGKSKRFVDEDIYVFYNRRFKLKVTKEHHMKYKSRKEYQIRTKRAYEVAKLKRFKFIKPFNLPLLTKKRHILLLNKFSNEEFGMRRKPIKYSREFYEKVKELIEQGYGTLRLAKKLGISPYSASWLIRRYKKGTLLKEKEKMLWNINNPPDVMLWRDFLQLLGWYISEGSVFKSTKKSKSLVCSIALDGVFDDKIKQLLDKYGIKYSIRKGGGEIRFCCYELCKALLYYGGKHAKGKFIHPEIFKVSDKEDLKVLFQSLYEGDGTKVGNTLIYTTTSKRLAEDVCFLAYLIGYHAKIREVKNGRYKIYRVKIYKPKKLLCNIKVKKERYKGWVYDITVEDNHNFFATYEGQFVLVGNCDHLLDSLGRGYTLRYDRLKKFLDERLKHKWNVALKSGEYIDVYDFVYDLSNKLENIPANEEVESLKYRLKQILDNIDDLKIKTSPADNKILLFYRYPGKLLQKLFRISNKKMLFMSATMQDLVVLQDYYWIDPKDVAFIYGKETWPGKLKILKTKRFPVTHKTWDKIKPDYIKYFRKIIDELVKRGYSVLIQAHAFKYVNQLGVPIDDAKHDILSKFIEKKIKVLASTRTKRGFDWRKDIVAKKCIIIPKFPLPDKQDLRIQALFENLSPQLAKAVYYDIARRELIQAIGRGLRSEDDELLLVVLDSIAYKFIKSGGWNMEEISLEGDINAIKTN